jgi:hypothetical protein
MDPTELMKQLEPAFAEVFRKQYRATLAAAALQGLLASFNEGDANRLFDMKAIAEDAVALADATLEVLEK